MNYKYFLTFVFSTSSLFSSINYYYNNSEKVYLIPITIESVSRSAALIIEKKIVYYTTSTNNIVGVSNRVIVKFSSLKNYDEMIRRYNLTMIKKMYQNVYLFEVEDNLKILDITNGLYRENDIVYAHPNFVKSVRKR